MHCRRASAESRAEEWKDTRIEAPAIVTIDPKTRVAEKSRRPVLAREAAAEGNAPPASTREEKAARKPTTARRVGAHDGSVKPANDAGPRKSAIVTGKKGRHPSLRDGKAAAEDVIQDPPGGHGAGRQQPNPLTTDRNSAIITVRDRKTVQRQPEQQQMAKLMRSGGTTALSARSAIIRKPSRFDDITPEEHKRRGDAADAMFQEFTRLIAIGEPPQ